MFIVINGSILAYSLFQLFSRLANYCLFGSWRIVKMQYDQLDPIKMTLNELRIQFATIRVDLKHTEQELQRTSQELTQLKNRPEKKSPRWKMALGAGMSILIAANSILINVGTGMLASNPPNFLGYLVIAFASSVYVICILVTTFIVGGRVHE